MTTATTKTGVNLSSFCSEVSALNQGIGQSLVLTTGQRAAFNKLEANKIAITKNWRVVESSKMVPTVTKALETLRSLESRFKSSNILDQSVENFGYYWSRWRVTDKMGYILGQMRDFGITGIKKATGESDKVEMFIKISSVAGATFLGYLYGGSIGAFTPIVGYYAIKTCGWMGALATGSALAGNHFLGKIGLIAGPIFLGLGRAFYFNKRAPEKAAALKEKAVILPSGAIGIRVKSVTDNGFPKLVVNTQTYSHSLKKNQELTERSLCHFFSKLNKVNQYQQYQLEDEVSSEKAKESEKLVPTEVKTDDSDGFSSEFEDEVKLAPQGGEGETATVVVTASDNDSSTSTTTSVASAPEENHTSSKTARPPRTHVRVDRQPPKTKAYAGGILNPLNWF